MAGGTEGALRVQADGVSRRPNRSSISMRIEVPKEVGHPKSKKASWFDRCCSKPPLGDLVQVQIWMSAEDLQQGAPPNRGVFRISRNARMLLGEKATKNEVASQGPDRLQKKG